MNNALVKNLSTFVDQAVSNRIVVAIATLLVVLYSGNISPNLPGGLVKLFDNPLAKVLVYFAIAMLAIKNITMALVVAVAFYLTVAFIGQIRINEGFVAGLNDHYSEN